MLFLILLIPADTWYTCEHGASTHPPSSYSLPSCNPLCKRRQKYWGEEHALLVVDAQLQRVDVCRNHLTALSQGLSHVLPQQIGAGDEFLQLVLSPELVEL